MSNVDLHIHSRYSDGLLWPDALCTLALRKGVSVLALCDHDTVDGLAPMRQAVAQAVGNGRDLRLIPSVEISTGVDGQTHILGYGVRPELPTVREVLTRQRLRRRERGLAIRERLAQLDMPLLPPESKPGEDELLSVGRAHIARQMVAAGYVGNVEQAFERYLGVGKPAYVPQPHFPSAEAVEWLSSTGAVPVLAHPAELKLPPETLEPFVHSLMEHGLRGLEVYHPSASRRELPVLESMARRNGLLVTGGSDYHGDAGTRGRIGGLPSGWSACESDLRALQSAIEGV